MIVKRWDAYGGDCHSSTGVEMALKTKQNPPNLAIRERPGATDLEIAAHVRVMVELLMQRLQTKPAIKLKVAV
jgi:hypothetical protein